VKSRLGAAAILLALSVTGCGGGGTTEVAESSPDVTAPPDGVLTAPPDGVLLKFEDATVSAEVVATSEERQLGLMHREDLDPDAGMLFLFARPSDGGFWMKNTLIPLSIAYMRREGERSFEVVNVLDMEPCRKDPCRAYDPGVAYDAALEVNQGWFERHGVSKGSVAQAEGELPTPT
jgi:uncharacterized membrane protein (UPF0127 family)